MAEAVETRIYRLHYDPHTSERIGYLTSQQRLAYNIAVSILNRTPAIVPRRSPAHPDGLLGQITVWRHQDGRAEAPYIIHQAGAQQAWMANDLMRQERKARLHRIENGSARSSDHRQHRRTLARRSRKHGPSTLTSLIPPVRLDDSVIHDNGRAGCGAAYEEARARRSGHPLIPARRGQEGLSGSERSAVQAPVRAAPSGGCGVS